MRTNTIDASRRSQTSISRATIREIDDDHLMQEIKTADVYHSETATNFENPQPLGFTCVAMPQDQQQGQQGQQGGSSGGAGGGSGGGNGGGNPSGNWNNNQPQGPSSEGVVSYGNGSRAHPIMTSYDDRRVRAYGQKPGEGQFYAPDGSAQTIYYRNRENQQQGSGGGGSPQQTNGGSGNDKDGLYLVTLDDQQQQLRAGQQRLGLEWRDGQGQQSKQRRLSLAHVEKKRQQRTAQQQGGGGGGGSGGGGGAGGGSGSGQSQLPDGSNSNYKHEGDTVNTEVRLTKSRIQFFKKTQSSGGGGGGGGQLQPTNGGGGSSSRQDGELRGYWDNDEQSWWWKADQKITHDADQEIDLKSPKIKHDTQKQVFTGDVHIMGNLYVKQGYKPDDDVWLTGEPNPNMDDLKSPVSEEETARQIKARDRRNRIFRAISVDDDGNVTVTGNLSVSGNLTVGGIITARDFVRA